MRYPIISILLITLIYAIPSRAAEDNIPGVRKSANEKIITPAQGLGKISIGNTNVYVIDIMGEPSKKYTFSEEKRNYSNYGYDISKQLLFYIGFDYYFEYSPEANKSEYPIWKIYFKDNKVVYINISSFIFDKADINSYGILPRCFFGGKRDDIINTLGEKYLHHVDESKNHDYYYMNKGVLVIIVNDVIRVFHIFKPLDEKQAKEFWLRLKGKSAI